MVVILAEVAAPSSRLQFMQEQVAGQEQIKTRKDSQKNQNTDWHSSTPLNSRPESKEDANVNKRANPRNNSCYSRSTIFDRQFKWSFSADW
jgi:hypothetical protein